MEGNQLTEIKELNFKKAYDRYRVSKTLAVDKVNGEKVAVILNDLDVTRDELQN